MIITETNECTLCTCTYVTALICIQLHITQSHTQKEFIIWDESEHSIESHMVVHVWKNDREIQLASHYCTLAGYFMHNDKQIRCNKFPIHFLWSIILVLTNYCSCYYTIPMSKAFCICLSLQRFFIIHYKVKVNTNVLQTTTINKNMSSTALDYVL